VVVDSTLLDALPPDLDGTPLIRDDATAADVVAGRVLPHIAAVAVGLYATPGSSTDGDFAIVNVVRLQAGVFDDSWFRTWRADYDEEACAPAGGVAPGAAEAEIDGRTLYIGTCRGGAHTYHVHLTDPDRLISITSFGTGRFGERVVAGLTE
jgi:hypothetical protein